jgi:small subunit ribosomal protein S6
MPLRTYEIMTIHRPEMAEDDARARVSEIEQLLAARGAKVSSSDFWGKRRFAYEIKHINEGFYSVIQFETDDLSPVDDLDRALGLSDAVVRHKILRTDNP